MTNEFTADELREITRAARVFSPGFSEEQFQSLTELQARLAHSGYPEAVSGLVELEKEKGVHLSQALETHDRLLQENAELERKVAARRAELDTLETQLRETQEKCQGVGEATEHAKAQLQDVRREQERDEKELSAFGEKAARERQRIDQELAEYRRKADVAEEDITTCARVKKEVARYGYTVELALGLAQEFAGYGDAPERLAEALKKHGELTSHLAALEADMKTLGENRRHLEGMLSRLGEERVQHEMVLSQLEAEIAEKGELVGSYHRYVHLRSLIEYVGDSNHLTFHHCMWCGALFWVLRPGNVPSSIHKSAHGAALPLLTLIRMPMLLWPSHPAHLSSYYRED